VCQIDKVQLHIYIQRESDLLYPHTHRSQQEVHQYSGENCQLRKGFAPSLLGSVELVKFPLIIAQDIRCKPVLASDRANPVDIMYRPLALQTGITK